MEGAITRPTHLLPLRVVAALLLVAAILEGTAIVLERHDLLAQYPALSPKLLATRIALIFFGALALAFLAFWRQRFGLWMVLACAAAELAIETWAGFSPLYLLRIPVGAASVFVTARYAWPELRGLSPLR